MMGKVKERINKNWKRFVSALLVVCILTGMAGSNSIWGGITSLASTELQEEDLGNMGRNNATAYKIISSGDTLSAVGKGWGGPSYRFDLKGIKDGQTESDYDSAGISGTYLGEGVSTYLAMAGKGRTSPPSGWADIPKQAASYDPTSVVIKTKEPGEPDAPDESANYFLAKLGQRDKNGNLITTGDHEYKNGAVERITFGDGTDANPEIEVEYKMTVTPGSENGYVVVDYYIAHVGGDVPPEGRKFWLGSGFDRALGGAADVARKTDRGIYVASTRFDPSEMEIIDNSPELGIYDPFSTKYLAGGDLSTRFIASEGDSSNFGSPGIDYSWEINLRPNETIHRRTAFRIRPNVNYVSWAHGEDSDREGYGAFSKPYKTLDYAIRQGRSRGGDVHILVQDYRPIDKAVELLNYDNLVISSSEIDINGNNLGESVQTLSRAPGYEGPLFKWVAGRDGTLRFENITLDGSGGGSEPLVLVAEQYNAPNLLEIGSGTSMINNKAGAVSFDSPGDLYIDGGTKGVVIKNNVSEKGAVDFSGGGTFSMKNKVIIKDNQKEGGPANVYLPDGKHIEVDGDLGESVVGITTQNMPGTSVEGGVTEAAQEIQIAVPTDQYPGFTGDSPFADNFFADMSARGDYTASGEPGLGQDNNRNTVIRRSGYRLTKSYLDTSTGGAIPGRPDEPLGIAQGDTVNLEPPGTVSGYRLKDVSIEQGAFTDLAVDKTAGGDFGRVTGTMPGQEVTVYYEYDREPSQLIFVPNGGTPAPPVLSGLAGNPVTAKMPVISRYGYIFKGWTEDASVEHPVIITSLPAAYPLSPKTYYAVFEPDPSVKFNLTVEYTDTTGNLMFQTNTIENAYSAEDSFVTAFKNVPNFKWSIGDSQVVPETYDYDGSGPEPTGSSNPATGKFTGKMPAMDTVVRYVFQKDSSQPQQVVTAGGYLNNGIEDWEDVDGDNIDRSKLISDSRFDQPSRTAFPGEEVTIQPKSVYGYKVVFGFIDTGKDTFERGAVPSENPADYPLSDRFLVFGGKGSFDSDWNFTGWMPNQEFGISYVYEPTDEGYQFTTKYLDRDTQDTKLENIVQPVIENRRAEAPVNREYQEQYGYTLTGQSFAPDSADVSWTDGTTLTGRMPNEDLLVTYTHNRLLSKWAEITYKPGEKGSLQGEEGVSSDVQPLFGGEFKANILINDKISEDRDKAYTLADIKEKRLMPVPKPESKYYRFGGWFIDTDNNGKLDGNETILPQDYQFDGPAAITAHFEENPDAWITIRFEAGEHGTINTGEPITLRTTYDKRWADIQAGLPQCTPEVNYLPDGWYVQGEPMEGDMPLVNGQTYTIQFYPDPAVFGTNVSAPNAMAGLNTQGKGRVTIFGTAQGYKYIITDRTGEVLAVNKGNLLTSRTYFDNLHPGTGYAAYEATGSTRVKAGDMIGEVQGIVSDAAQVVTPVVETNYQVFYDEEDEGKTQLVIKPADPASDYAVLDSSGNVVHTPQTSAAGWQKPSGSPAGLEFTGLGYNAEYTVVARPSGRNEITAESCREYGSVIAADPGGELELPDYIIETVNGEVEAVGGTAVGVARYEDAYKGDLVKITAESVDGAGNSFSHWEFAIGSVKGHENVIRQREVSFTMPDTNLVLAAVYERGTSTPSNARAVYEVRGGSRDELALDPDGITELEGNLTTDADRELLDVNRADVTYKVVYRKNAVKASESNAIKTGGLYNTDHQEAYKEAWGLDVSIERYVNGRRVNRASASNASFRTFVQMEKSDVDMMDYQLYELIQDPDDGSITVNQIPMDYDPEKTGGLFTFMATEGGRYVMVYNRAYRLYFLNNTVPVESRYRYYFKVRRNEWPGQDYYAAEYAGVETQPDYFVSPEGAEYNYIGWSYRPNKLRDFDPNRQITRKTYVYAFYEDNLKEVGKAREELEQEILKAIGLSDDYFLKLQESKKLKEYIEAAQEILDREPKVTMSHLEDALKKLKKDAAPYKELLDERYDRYHQIHEEGNKGGSGGGGGGGRGTKKAPFNGIAPKSYQIAKHGNWVEGIGPSGEKQLKFRLNGGHFLRGMWARLEYPEADRAAGNGWYRFDSNGNVQSGWICDEVGKWYYCNTEKEGYFGRMATGWKFDEGDGNWYYLDSVSGEMALGWKQIGGKWYYFSPTGEGVYTYDPTKEIWTFGGGSGRPLGSMYKNEVTPDGYHVGVDGAWIQ